MKRSFLSVLVLSLCLTGVSVSQQKEKYQHFIYVITPCFVSFRKDWERLVMAESEAIVMCAKNGRGEVSNSLVIPKVDDWNKVASEVESFRFSPSDLESLAQFVSDPLLISTIDHFQKARAILSVASSYEKECSGQAKDFDSFWSVSQLDKYKDDLQEARRSFIRGAIAWNYVIETCNWLIAKYNLQYDKSLVDFDPIEIARQKGRTRPYHRKQ